jgi:hypothetical protein
VSAARRTGKKTWKDLVEDVIAGLPREFTLAEVLAYKERLAREYPNNRFLEAKIRQTLQILRDQGRVAFLGKGRYRRLESAPAISLLLDLEPAAPFASRSQIARVVIETWAELNLYCLSCSSDRLKISSPGTPLVDFTCPACDHEYQLKSKNGRFDGKVTGAAYGPVIQAICAGRLPDYVLAEYDLRRKRVEWVWAVPGPCINCDHVKARTALQKGAHRAGWVGCTINLEGLPQVDIVVPKPEDRAVVRQAWQRVLRTSR